jgi:serine-type D-Ala-D-Ala carboxypeptidase/endopeptidase (penicillin-binding protein 4)
LGARIEQILRSGDTLRRHWGILVVDGDTGVIDYAINADHFFAPASSAKIVTTALALAELGPRYKFRTTLESTAPVQADGTLPGDLFIVGRGDPDLSNRKFPFAGKDAREGSTDRELSEMADAIVARGLRRINGDIVADDSYFPYDPYPADWTTGDLFFEFGAPVTALTFNDNTMYVTVRPGASLNDSAGISVDPPGAASTFDYDISTVAPGGKSEFAVVREPGPNFLLLRATIALGHAPIQTPLAMTDPSLTIAMTVKQLLEARGVRITGDTKIKHSAPPQTTPAGDPVLPAPTPSPSDAGPRVVLAEHLSPPLIESVRLTNKISQNLHAELFLRAVGREKLGLGSTAAGLKAERDFLAHAGAGAGDIVLSDGSGLARDDLVTPLGMVAVLRYASRQPWGGDFEASLPVAGVDGTIADRMKETPAAGKIEAKTGTIEHAHALAGYATTRHGGQVVFAIFCDDTTDKFQDATRPVDQIAEAIVELAAPATPPKKTPLKK